MTSYLILADLAAAQARSAQRAQALGCEAPTEFWWGQIENPTTKLGALHIEGSGDFGAAGLTSDEVAALVPAASMDPTWFPEVP